MLGWNGEIVHKNFRISSQIKFHPIFHSNITISTPYVRAWSSGINFWSIAFRMEVRRHIGYQDSRASGGHFLKMVGGSFLKMVGGSFFIFGGSTPQKIFFGGNFLPPFNKTFTKFFVLQKIFYKDYKIYFSQNLPNFSQNCFFVALFGHTFANL